MKVKILTLGCKVNQFESQAMFRMLTDNGYTVVDENEPADIAILNSCAVTQVSEQKAVKLLHRLRRENPFSVIVLTGCMAQTVTEKDKRLSDVDIILGNKRRQDLIPVLEQYLSARQPMTCVEPYAGKDDYEALYVDDFRHRTSAFLKIEDGCNRFCSYCIIPYARGRVRSKPLADLKREIGQVAASGYREVVLVGINLSAYGQGEDFDLADAVEAACAVEGIARVRLGSIEPEQMDEALIARLAAQPKLCPQFHLSLQSGCDKTLRAMNRHYDTAEYAQIVQNLRRVFSNASMTTDVMVGFAGEREEDFQASMDFVEQIGFAKVHVFPYSVRKGTRAEHMPDQVSPAEKERRAHRMGELTDRCRRAFLQTQVGLTEEVLFERKRHGYWEGYTKNYTPVHVASDDASLCGEIRPVRLTGVGDDWCDGVLV